MVFIPKIPGLLKDLLMKISSIALTNVLCTCVTTNPLPVLQPDSCAPDRGTKLPIVKGVSKLNLTFFRARLKPSFLGADIAAALNKSSK